MNISFIWVIGTWMLAVSEFSIGFTYFVIFKGPIPLSFPPHTHSILQLQLQLPQVFLTVLGSVSHLPTNKCGRSPGGIPCVVLAPQEGPGPPTGISLCLTNYQHRARCLLIPYSTFLEKIYPAGHSKFYG